MYSTGKKETVNVLNQVFSEKGEQELPLNELKVDSIKNASSYWPAINDHGLLQDDSDSVQ